MSKQCLDVHQMQHLQELGLDTRNASMCWIKDTEGNQHLSVHDEYCYEASFMHPIPAYTLQDVLEGTVKQKYILLNRTDDTLGFSDVVRAGINDRITKEDKP